MQYFQPKKCNKSITLPEVFFLKCSVSTPRLKEISKHEVQRIMGILYQTKLDFKTLAM